MMFPTHMDISDTRCLVPSDLHHSLLTWHLWSLQYHTVCVSGIRLWRLHLPLLVCPKHWTLISVGSLIAGGAEQR